MATDHNAVRRWIAVASHATVVLLLLVLSRCSPRRTAGGWESTDADFLFAAQFLYNYFIFQERLPADPFAFSSPRQLYRSVDEPYTVYLPDDVARMVLSSLETRTTGLGVLLDPADDGYVVTDVLPASPAERAGIEEGDTLVSVNGVTVTEAAIGNLLGLLRGEVGELRDVVVGRPGRRVRFAVPLTSFLAPSVFCDSINDAVAYIYITAFLSTSEGLKGTRKEFVEALQRTAWASTILLDLRGNGGGELMQSVGVAEELLPRGAPVIRIIERVYDTTMTEGFVRDTTYRASQGGVAADRDLVVLMDGGTASGAELLIAALRDDRADMALVGSRTVGKGRAQVLALTPNSGLARVTNALLRPATGELYDCVGIEPTIPVREPLDILQVATLVAQRDLPSAGAPNPGTLRRIALLRWLYGPGPQPPLALYHRLYPDRTELMAALGLAGE